MYRSESGSSNSPDYLNNSALFVGARKNSSDSIKNQVKFKKSLQVKPLKIIPPYQHKRAMSYGQEPAEYKQQMQLRLDIQESPQQEMTEIICS